MARYTKYLFEYLKDGFELPAAFSTIPAVGGKSFSDLFTIYYKWDEIGFDTEWRFHDALEALADVICPYYVQLLEKDEKIDAALGGVTTETRTTFSAPSATAGNNEAGKETITRDQTTADLLAILADMDGARQSLYQRLLREFQPLFMGVW